MIFFAVNMVNSLPIPRPGSDGSYAGDNYFQYINVPAHKTFEWGYRRGNPHHNREEYLSQKDHTFKAKVRLKSVKKNCCIFTPSSASASK